MAKNLYSVFDVLIFNYYLFLFQQHSLIIKRRRSWSLLIYQLQKIEKKKYEQKI